MRKIAISLFLLLLFQAAGFAQDPNEKASGEEEKKPTTPEEFRTRAEIDRAEERLRKLVSSAEELNKLAQDLARTASKKNQLSGDDQKKLGKIEKLAKHVRSEQGGGGDDDDLSDPPQNLGTALDRLQQATDAIEKETCKITRHGVSVQLIERTNEVIAITKTIKKMVTK
jgi:hypothetical protein